jgi:hypothetical protein
MNKSPTLRAFIPTILILNFFGWGGIVTLLNLYQPTLIGRILFFTCIMMAFSGISLPGVIFLNKRFPTSPAPGGNVLLRESMWVGIYFSILAWLSYGRVVSFGLATIFFIGILALEFFLRFREISQRPKTPYINEI